MDAELLEWHTLSSAARHQLLAPARLLSDGPVLCAATFPSFEAGFSFTAVLQDRSAGPLAIERHWNREEDAAKFESVPARLRAERPLSPTVIWLQGAIDAADAEALLARVAVRVPVSGVRGSMGLDGTSYILSCTSGGAHVAFEWWNSAPPEWSELAHVHREIERIVRAAVARPTVA